MPHAETASNEIAITTAATPSWRTDLAADPVRRLAGPIAEAVERLAGALPPVRIVITGRAAGAWIATQAEASAVGGASLRTRLGKALATWRSARAHDAQAMTLLGDRSEVLVVLCAPDLLAAGETNLIETLGHELVHAAQLNRPGRRQSRLADLQGNYGLVERPIAESYRAEAQICLEEAEAHELEPAILAAVRA
ncbi:hypothetical protein ACFV84_35120 [Kitasatospora sp. NPDC059811]|uniref:hypothetical protein n=1 Tax=Streptomycetaceae TaxID=2062 RepID=UPI0007AF0FE3|nr:hypothetical protein [Streptomyces sp. MJM8645]